MSDVQNVALSEVLSISIRNDKLLQFVFDAVYHVEWVHTVNSVDSEIPEAALRTVLTYCYATRILSSAEIEEAAVHDHVVRYLCANDHPSREVIREFRRRNHAELVKALTRLFSMLFASRPSKFEFTELLRFHNVHSEAERRIARAIQADTAAMDD